MPARPGHSGDAVAGYHRPLPGYKPPPLMFNDDEALALTLSPLVGRWVWIWRPRCGGRFSQDRKCLTAVTA